MASPSYSPSVASSGKKDMAFLDQDLFTKLLCLERKRSERTGTHFGLALLYPRRIFNLKPLCDTLLSKVRETDLAGWYRQKEVAAVIFYCELDILYTDLLGQYLPHQNKEYQHTYTTTTEDNLIGAHSQVR